MAPIRDVGTAVQARTFGVLALISYDAPTETAPKLTEAFTLLRKPTHSFNWWHSENALNYGKIDDPGCENACANENSYCFGMLCLLDFKSCFGNGR